MSDNNSAHKSNPDDYNYYTLVVVGDIRRLCNEHEEDHSTPSDIFHPFPKLPAEIQVVVFQAALEGRHIASLTRRPTGGRDEDIRYGRISPLFFVNKLACELAERRFPIYFRFSTCIHGNIVREEGPRPSYQLSDDSGSQDEDSKDEDVRPCGCDTVWQNCRIGSDDIVALRIEEEMCTAWYHNWMLWYESGWESFPYESAFRNAVTPYFHGWWEGDYKKIKNLMVPAPLNMFHLDHSNSTASKETELNELSLSKCRIISEWYQELFHDILGSREAEVPKRFKNVYCLAYGWMEPKRQNLTLYDIESADKCLPNFTNAENYVKNLEDVPPPKYLVIKGHEVVRHNQRTKESPPAYFYDCADRWPDIVQD